MTMDGRLQIQFIAEKILRKHNIDPASESYYLKLRMPGYDDLVIEKHSEGFLLDTIIIIRAVT